VHNVALIPNYFSSGEEETAHQQQMRFADGLSGSLMHNHIQKPDFYHGQHQIEENNFNRQADSFSSSSQRTANNRHQRHHNHYEEESEHQLVISQVDSRSSL
jgi:hypothetical protein